MHLLVMGKHLKNMESIFKKLTLFQKMILIDFCKSILVSKTQNKQIVSNFMQKVL